MSHRSLCALRLAGRPSCRTSRCEAVLMPYPQPARDGAAVESVNAVPSGAAQIVERATARRAADPLPVAPACTGPRLYSSGRLIDPRAVTVPPGSLKSLVRVNICVVTGSDGRRRLDSQNAPLYAQRDGQCAPQAVPRTRRPAVAPPRSAKVEPALWN